MHDPNAKNRNDLTAWLVARGHSSEKAAAIAGETYVPPPRVPLRHVNRVSSGDDARVAMRRRGAIPLDAEGNEIPDASELAETYAAQELERRQADYNASIKRHEAEEASNARCSAALAAIEPLPPNATDYERVARAGKVERAILAATRGES